MNYSKSRHPRVLYVANDVDIPSTRGSFTHTYEIAKNLQKKGFRVSIVARRRRFTEPSQEDFDGISVFRYFRRIPTRPLPPQLKKKEVQGSYTRYDPFNITLRFGFYLYRIYLQTFLVLITSLFLIRLIKKCQIDVVLERGSALGAGVLAARITRRPTIVEIIDDNHSTISLRMADKVILYSQRVLKRFVPKDRMIKVTAAANTDLFNPKISSAIIRNKFGVKRRRIIGYAGNFEKWHGILDLVESAKYILKVEPNIIFLLVGNVNDEIIQVINTTKRRDSFILPGSVDYVEVPQYLAAADVLVAPFNPAGADHTKKYGYIYSPIKIFEYMSMGKPIIVSDLPHIRDVIQDEIDGILIPPGKPQELAHAILRILHDDQLATTLSNNARKKVVQLYSWDKLTSIFSKVILSTLSNSKENK